jgi:1,4-dihydroxy-2-naphthoate octaprenyltransferase
VLEKAPGYGPQGKTGLKKWLMVIRAPFLPLAIILGFLGACIAWYYSNVNPGYTFHLGYAFLAGFGLLLAHISVDVLNEYFDLKSGVDLETIRTPFSGGSGALPQGLVTPRQALWLGFGCLIAIVPVGIYFTVVKGIFLLPLLLVAAVCTIFYSPVILRTSWPEWAPGLGLGALPVLGAFFVQAGEYAVPAIIASVPSFILVHNLLLLNEFPDVEADRKGGRKTTPIIFGRKKAGIFYAVMTGLVYVWIIGGVIAGQMPVWSLVALLTLPFAVRAILGALKPDDMSKLVPAMANNVLVVLLTQLLLGTGYIMARVF